MLRSILGVVFGIALGAVAVAFVQRIGQLAYPAPKGVDLKDPAQLREVMRAIPLGAKAFVIGSWGAGSLAAAAGALLVARRWAPAAWVASGTLFAMAGMTMIEIPHPAWMVAAAAPVFAAGAYLPIRTLGGTYAPPARAKGPFEK